MTVMRVPLADIVAKQSPDGGWSKADLAEWGIPWPPHQGWREAIEVMSPGWCQHCRVKCRERLGVEIYPNRPDLAAKVIWECPRCEARVGTHEEGKLKGQPLGSAANAELRRARQLLHGKIDPLWQNAYKEPEYEGARNEPNEAERRKKLAIIRNTARNRVYAFIAAGMGMAKDECHVALMGLEQCRAVWRMLDGVEYPLIRQWAHDLKALKEQLAAAADPAQQSDPPAQAD